MWLKILFQIYRSLPNRVPSCRYHILGDNIHLWDNLRNHLGKRNYEKSIEIVSILFIRDVSKVPIFGWIEIRQTYCLVVRLFRWGASSKTWTEIICFPIWSTNWLEDWLWTCTPIITLVPKRCSGTIKIWQMAKNVRILRNCGLFPKGKNLLRSIHMDISKFWLRTLDKKSGQNESIAQ